MFLLVMMKKHNIIERMENGEKQKVKQQMIMKKLLQPQKKLHKEQRVIVQILTKITIVHDNI